MKQIAAIALALSVAFASPVLAQGHGAKGNKGKGQDKQGKAAVVRTTKAARAQTSVTQNGSARQRSQGRVTTTRDGRRYDQRDRYERRDRYEQRRVYSTGKARGGSPAFCRSGAGHPVFGRSWCVQKGFGLGDARWNRATWGDVIFRSRRSTSLSDVLGSIVFGRVANYAAQSLGLRSPLTGTWLVNSPDRTVYLVRSGSTPVAEFVDTNYDGRADFVLLHSR